MLNNELSGLYVTIHGPDGVGKTTVGRSVANTLIGRGHATEFFDDWRNENHWNNPFSNAKIRKLVGENNQSFVALQVAKVAVDSIVITDLINKGITVIKDRGIMDVRADLKYRGFDPADCYSPMIREPDFTVLLTVNEEGRYQRLCSKNDLRSHDYQPNLPGHRMYDMNQYLIDEVDKRVPEKGLILPTDGLSIEAVVGVITERLHEYYDS